MDHEANRKEFAQEMLAGNRLRDTVRQMLAESTDRFLIEHKEESRFRASKTEARAVCQFDNGLRYLVEYDERVRRGEVRFWHTKITNLDTERLTHQFGFLVTQEFFELSSEGWKLPRFTRFCSLPAGVNEQDYFFDGVFATTEMVEELRQGISSAYVLPYENAKKTIERHDKIDYAKEQLHQGVFKNLGGYALFLAGVKARTIAQKFKRSTR